MKNPQETFLNLKVLDQNAERKEFENCEFKNCSFHNLSNLIFRDCIFTNCNLSNLKTSQTILQNCVFKDCKLLGLNFAGAKEFALELHFENCNMDFSSFDKIKLNKSSFKKCRMHEVNLTQANLSKCLVQNCDLHDALFSGTNLSGLDLRSSVNFLIDPEFNNIRKAKFSLNSLPGLLHRYEIIVDNS